ncbi:MAG: hypothetical protein JO011_08445 [Ktedonobacteraceae bacterium]|nr:hypothetical protein [Ktedonobacteraceae bacterium]MBV9710927.1 hypothetical protein [Ktedonobacteraceae bacterium]
MKRIASVMVMHARDRATWFLGPWIVLGAGFVICLLITLSIDLLWGGTTPVYTGALACIYFVMLIEAIGNFVRTFPFAVGFGTRRRDYLLGTLAWGIAFCASWAILLGLFSLLEANVIENWGVGLHFFHLPFFSDGSPLQRFCWSYYHDMACAHSDPNYFRGGSSLQQFWVYFVLLLFMYMLGLLLGSIYQRFGRTGEYIFSGIVFLLLSAFLLLSSYWQWWRTIFGWLAQQTAASLGLWLVPLIVIFALTSYALQRKATV